MSRRVGLALVLALLVAGGVAVMLGEVEGRAGLTSVFQIWGDVLRDADRVGLGLTRVSAEQETELGEEIFESMSHGWDWSEEWGHYVSEVGRRLAPYAQRTGIRYRFHVVESPAINAFALPGGHVFVLTGMLEFVESEAELAAILGHEIAHVDLRHCVERYQYRLAMDRAGVGAIGELTDFARRFVAIGYSKQQELEADVRGVRYSIEAGYDPQAAVRVFERLAEEHGRRTRRAPDTPLEEVGGVLEEALGSWLDSHPDALDRSRQLESHLRRGQSELAGREFYEGGRNLQLRIPRGEREFPGEVRVVPE